MFNGSMVVNVITNVSQTFISARRQQFHAAALAAVYANITHFKKSDRSLTNFVP